ncbi:MAG: phenylalanine--tRNA ligase subunit alpha [Bifidobacteriaceae bacterium]|jgi:phenylalanyl-tRNA synthetase alpha chain|nr:phenylalanine--tRNA ligase subunit alpha [Bifidobacteriaceae bacterium]
MSNIDYNEIENLPKLAKSDFESAVTADDLAKLKTKYFGDNSVLVMSSKAIGGLSVEEKPKAGKVLGAARAAINELFDAATEAVKINEEALQYATEFEDMTTPVEFLKQKYNVTPIDFDGAVHPINGIINEIQTFFRNVGWTIGDGPEVEATEFNFDKLNFGKDHPARQMQDTFYIEKSSGTNPTDQKIPDQKIDENQTDVNEKLVMRTHTSPVQARALKTHGVPLYIAVPGKVYRTDELDATHTPVFHQCEGLAIDKDLTMADLKGVLELFAKAMFGEDAKTRLRPSYFPFTEPSAELDVWYPNKKGGAGWIEWGGCGMVNENVLTNCGVDPKEYRGFAFGVGIERTLILRHNINDMHDIVEGDVRFSNQLGLGVL